MEELEYEERIKSTENLSPDEFGTKSAHMLDIGKRIQTRRMKNKQVG